MKGIYLAAFKAYHPGYDIVYQDINGNRDLGGDMMNVDLSEYDFVIASPPCNYWSKANYRRDNSDYSLKTKHLLIDILVKLRNLNKPYIVENVKNKTLFKKYGLYPGKEIIYEIGRHTYWSNIILNDQLIKKVKSYDIQNLSHNNRQGTYEVNQVIDLFLKTIYY